MQGHKALYEASENQIDMDVIQGQILKDLPEFNQITMGITLVSSFLFWIIGFIALKKFMIEPFVWCWKKRMPMLKHYNELNDYEKMVYVGQITSIVHAVYATVGAIFGFFYADG